MTNLEQLTLFAADSLASLTVLPGSDAARQMTVTSGRKCAALLPPSGPLGLLVKMCLESDQLSSTRCYLTWKPWDTPQRRLLFRLVPSMPLTAATEFGFWPTATATDTQDRAPGTPHLTKNGTVRHANKQGTTSFMWLSQVAKMFPTPTRSDGMGGPENSGRNGGENLRTAVGGSLNPEFVEWLMGFPPGWTELKD